MIELAQAIWCHHCASRSFFLESILFKDLPRQTFPLTAAAEPEENGRTIVVNAFKCEVKPAENQKFGYNSDVESCGKPGKFVMATREEIPRIGKK